MTFVAMNHLCEPVKRFDDEDEANHYVNNVDALGGLGWTVEEVEV